MIEIILDTETTGLSISAKHRIVEIACIELKDQIPTGNTFHEYLNPERKVSSEAYKVHGYSDDFLSSKKKFSEIASNFFNFIKDKKLIIHNASFDLSFLNFECKIANLKSIDQENIIDTLEIARQKYPGSQNSLDALCKRFNIDNSRREKHTALIDCELLKEVYINLLDLKEPKLDLENVENSTSKLNQNTNSNSKENRSRIIVNPTEEELKLHKNFLANQLTKNNYN